MTMKAKVHAIVQAQEEDTAADAINQSDIDHITAANAADPPPNPLLEVPAAMYPMKKKTSVYLIQTAVYDDDTKAILDIRSTGETQDISETAKGNAVQSHITEWNDRQTARAAEDVPVGNDHDTEIPAD